VALSGEDALRWLERITPDLVLLDVMLSKRNGLSVLREFRRDGFQTPVLLLTALDSVEDRVLGLDAGADDYLVKPFAFPELLARVRALLRRTATTPQTTLDLADLHMNLAGRTASRDDVALELTSREFDLLEYLMLNRGRVVSREMLTRDVWKETMRYTSLDNVIDVQVARLRRKIDDPFDVKLLHTVRGIGFVLREE
jgi:DNA-binding response OmpR family regulator